MPVTKSINEYDFFQDLAITAKSESYTEQKKDIVSFLDEELDEESWGIQLTREQRIPLKVLYGASLDPEDREIIERWKFEDKTTWDPLDSQDFHQGLILEAGRRGGKTTIAAVIVAYEFYKLALMESPQRYYGIANSSPISMLAIATNATQTKRTVFKQIRGIIPSINSLKRLVQRKEIFVGKEEISYESKLLSIYAGNSESSGQVGDSIICLVLDEVARYDIDSEGVSNAEEIWSNIGLSGMTFGDDSKRIAISSAWCQGDAIEKFYNLAKQEDSLVGFRLKSWDINPVKAGRDNPVVKAEYSLNPLKAALEFEGKRLAPQNKFLNSDFINAAINGRSQISFYDETQSDDALCRKFITNVNPTDTPSFVHLDPGISGDAYALAIGHADKNKEGFKTVVIDGLMAWKPQRGEEVSISNVQKAILDINHYRPISKLTSDHHQNAETIQRLKSFGIPSEAYFFSNKLQMEMYEQLKLLINEGRLILPKNSPYKELLKDELNQLEVTNGIRIDHPKGGCFVGDTRIPLLDGSRPMISELEGKEVWVYSCSPEGKIVSGKAKGRKTKEVSKLVDVVLDSGAVVRCTPEHRFMMKNGEYIEAQNIIHGLTQLMSTGETHRVRNIIPVILYEPVAVYDLEVDYWHNFALCGGVFVHNSKDLSDCVAAICWHITGNETNDSTFGIARTFKKPELDPRSMQSSEDENDSFLNFGKARQRWLRDYYGKNADQTGI